MLEGFATAPSTQVRILRPSSRGLYVVSTSRPLSRKTAQKQGTENLHYGRAPLKYPCDWKMFPEYSALNLCDTVLCLIPMGSLTTCPIQVVIHPCWKFVWLLFLILKPALRRKVWNLILQLCVFFFTGLYKFGHVTYKFTFMARGRRPSPDRLTFISFCTTEPFVLIWLACNMSRCSSCANHL